MRKKRCYVEVRILTPGAHAASIRSRFETWFVPDGDDLTFRSPLEVTHPVSDHLKWFHGMLQFHRKFLRQLEGAGVQIVIRVTSDADHLNIEPEALLLAHKMHLPMRIHLAQDL